MKLYHVQICGRCGCIHLSLKQWEPGKAYCDKHRHMRVGMVSKRKKPLLTDEEKKQRQKIHNVRYRQRRGMRTREDIIREREEKAKAKERESRTTSVILLPARKEEPEVKPKVIPVDKFFIRDGKSVYGFISKERRDKFLKRNPEIAIRVKQQNPVR